MKKLFFLMACLVASTTMFAVEVVNYTLTPDKGSNNSYAGNCDVTIDGIVWNLTGNSQQIPWRIGGKSLTNVERTVYSKTAIADNISKIVVTHGTASSITINSVTLIVSTEANGAGSVISTIDGGTFTASSDMTFARPTDADWSNAYYKFVYNVTVSGTSNKYVQFSKAIFYTEVTAVEAANVNLDKSELTLNPYYTEKLTATLTPTDATTAIEWTSSDETVATVANGVVTALKEGTTTIKATAGEGIEATCAVTVNALPETWTCEYLAGVAVEMPEAIAFEGYVTGIYGEGWSDQYKNISFYLADEKDGGEVFLCYRAKPVDGTTAAAVGDKVSINGKVGMYNGKPQLLADCTYTIKETATALENIVEEAKAVKVIENGQLVIIKNGVRYNVLGTQL